MKLHYLLWKPQRVNYGEILIFLHGLGGTARIWRPITAALENKYLCIAPDQRGHGQSTQLDLNTTSFRSEDYAQDIFELIQSDVLTLAKPAPQASPQASLPLSIHLIGHSMGVRTALATTALFTTALAEKKITHARIKSVIAVDLGVSQQWGGGMGLPLAQFLKNLPEEFPSRKSLQEYVLSQCPDSSIARYLIAVSYAVPNSTVYRFPFLHQALVKTIEEAHHSPMEDWVKQAQAQGISLLFLQGKNSKVWSETDYLQQKQRLEGAFAFGSRTIFESWPDCGHGLPFEKREAFVERVDRWVTDQVNG